MSDRVEHNELLKSLGFELRRKEGDLGHLDYKFNSKMFFEARGLPEVPVPKPATPQSILPDESPSVPVSSGNVDLTLQANSAWMSVQKINELIARGEARVSPPLNVAGAQLAYSLFWKKIQSVTVVGPESYTHTVLTKSGMTTNDSETLQSEISANAGTDLVKLGAKLTETVGHSVQIMNETDVTNSYNVAPKSGETVVWTLWQLTDSFSLVDANGTPLNYNGVLDIFAGFVTIHISLSVPKPQFAHPTPTLYADSVTFHT